MPLSDKFLVDPTTLPISEQDILAEQQNLSPTQMDLRTRSGGTDPFILNQLDLPDESPIKDFLLGQKSEDEVGYFDAWIGSQSRNWVYGLLKDKTDAPVEGAYNPAFNVVEKLKGSKYEDFTNEFLKAGVTNERELEYVKEEYDSFLLSSKGYQDKGLLGMLPALAGQVALDPLTWVPTIGAYTAAVKAKSLWTAGVLGAAAITASNVASLKLEDQFSTIKTSEEDYNMVVAGSLVLGGLITAGAGAISKGKILDSLSEGDISKALDAVDQLGDLTPEKSIKSLEDILDTSEGTIKLKRDKLVKFASPLMKLSPVGRVLMSSKEFQSAKAGMMKLSRNNLEIEGIGPAGLNFEVEVDLWRKTAQNNLYRLEDDWKDYIKKGNKGSFEDFRNDVGLFLAHEQYKMPIPSHISAEAKLAGNRLRSEILTPAREGLIETKIYKKGDLNENYFPQVTNKRTLQGRKDEFVGKLGDYLKRTAVEDLLKEMEESIVKGASKKVRSGLKKELRAFQTSGFYDDVAERYYHKRLHGSAMDSGNPRMIAEAVEEELEKVASRIESKMGTTISSLFDTKRRLKISGFLKRRMINLPPNEFAEFLVFDPAEWLKGYTSSVFSDISSVKIFGTADPEKVADVILSKDLESISKLKDAARVEKLSKEAALHKSDIEAMHKRITGRHASSRGPLSFAGKAAEITNNLAYGLTSGGIALAQIGDGAKFIMQFPARRAFGGLLRHTFNDLKGLATGKHAVRAELKRMNVLLEKLDGNLLNEQLEMDLSVRKNHMDGLSQWMSMDGGVAISRAIASVGNRVNGMAFVMNQMEAFVGGMAMDETIRASMAATKGKLTKKQALILKKTGISTEDAADFVREFKKKGGGKIQDGFHLTNTENWDPEVAHRFKSFLNRQVSEGLSLPGQAKPFFMSGVGGRFFGMYKSFMMGAMQNTYTAALQMEAGLMAQAIGAFLFFGAASYVVKSLSKGQEPEFTPERLVIEGLDRSGAMTWFFDNIKYAEDITGLDPVTDHLNLVRNTRFKNQGTGLRNFSPSTQLLFKTVPDFITKAVIPTAKGRPTKETINATRRVILWGNNPIFATPLNMIGDALGEDLPAK